MLEGHSRISRPRDEPATMVKMDDFQEVWTAGLRSYQTHFRLPEMSSHETLRLAYKSAIVLQASRRTREATIRESRPEICGVFGIADRRRRWMTSLGARKLSRRKSFSSQWSGSFVVDWTFAAREVERSKTCEGRRQDFRCRTSWAGRIGSDTTIAGQSVHQHMDRPARSTRPPGSGGGQLLVPREPARVRLPRRGNGWRNPGEFHEASGIHLRQPAHPYHGRARGTPVKVTKLLFSGSCISRGHRGR